MFERIRTWAQDRNIIEGATVHAQFVKLVEEIGELAYADNLDDVKDGIGDSYVVCTILAAQMNFPIEFVVPPFDMNEEDVFVPDANRLLASLGRLAHAVAKNRIHEAKPAMQSVLEELHNVAFAHDISIEDCLEVAWNEIKDRKGRMIGGIFVKEADL